MSKDLKPKQRLGQREQDDDPEQLADIQRGTRRRREQVGRRPMSLTPLEEVQAAVLRQCLPLTPRAVDLQDALGCVTSAPLEAEELVPPFDNTAMDGFAVQAVDTTDPPVELKIVGTLAAGASPDIDVGPGQAVRTWRSKRSRRSARTRTARAAAPERSASFHRTRSAWVGACGPSAKSKRTARPSMRTAASAPSAPSTCHSAPSGPANVSSASRGPAGGAAGDGSAARAARARSSSGGKR